MAMPIPKRMFVVKGSPNISVPIRIAVIGSNTPNTEALAAPIFRVAMANVAVETIVGNSTVIHQRHGKQRVESVCDTGNNTGRIAYNSVFTQCFHSYLSILLLNNFIQFVLKDMVGLLYFSNFQPQSPW